MQTLSEDETETTETEITSKTAAFTVKVLDQFDIPMTADEYGLTWAIYKTGTEETDPNVTIDENGVVSVKKAFNTDDKVAAFDVAATVKTDDRGQTVKKTIYIGNNDIIYYEPLNWSQVGGTSNRNSSVNFINAVTLPDMTNVTLNLKYPNGTDGQSSLALVTDAGKLTGVTLVGDGRVCAWTGWNGNSAMNQYDDIFVGGDESKGLRVTELKTLIDNYTNGDTITVSFVIDKPNNAITVNCGGVTESLTYSIAPETLKGIQWGQYRSSGAITIDNVMIQEPDNDYLAIAGDADFAKISGTTVTREYTLGQSVLVDGETFTWSVEAPEGAEADAVTVANGDTATSGILSVADTATKGVYTLKAVSTINENKKAEFAVTVADFQGDSDNIQVTLAGAQAYRTTDTTGTYSVAKVTDKFGDDITALLPAAVWTIDNTDVATITSDGTLTVVGAGTATVTAKITNGTSTITKTVPVKVSAYSITGEASGDTTAVNTSLLVSGNDIAKYLVTTATADGTAVKSTEVAASDITSGSYTVDTKGAAKYEIAPIFSYNIGNAGTLGVYGDGFDIAIPADTYNFEVTVTGSRCDVYANDQMLVNNILQGGSVGNTVKVNDIVVDDGVAKITTDDYASGQTAAGSSVSVSVVKSPSIVNRAKKMYVLGDSLVCVYYNGANKDANWQTGWGQVLQNYVKDVEVVDLANSGITAVGLLGSAFTQVLESAKEGDYLVLESGYNDKTYDPEAVMKDSLRAMIAGAEEKGVKVILVSPNASSHTYGANVAWTTFMEDVATETETDYIDLSQKSYDFFESTYAGDRDNFKATYNVSDRLHSTFHGANKMAEIVAQGLYDLGHSDIVNTEYEYTFTDYLNNEITCKVKATDTSAE